MLGSRNSNYFTNKNPSRSIEYKASHKRAIFPGQVSCQVYFLMCTTNTFLSIFPWPRSFTSLHVADTSKCFMYIYYTYNIGPKTNQSILHLQIKIAAYWVNLWQQLACMTGVWILIWMGLRCLNVWKPRVSRSGWDTRSSGGILWIMLSQWDIIDKNI